MVLFSHLKDTPQNRHKNTCCVDFFNSPVREPHFGWTQGLPRPHPEGPRAKITFCHFSKFSRFIKHRTLDMSKNTTVSHSGFSTPTRMASNTVPADVFSHPHLFPQPKSIKTWCVWAHEASQTLLFTCNSVSCTSGPPRATRGPQMSPRGPPGAPRGPKMSLILYEIRDFYRKLRLKLHKTKK